MSRTESKCRCIHCRHNKFIIDAENTRCNGSSSKDNGNNDNNNNNNRRSKNNNNNQNKLDMELFKQFKFENDIDNDIDDSGNDIAYNNESGITYHHDDDDNDDDNNENDYDNDNDGVYSDNDNDSNAYSDADSVYSDDDDDDNNAYDDNLENKDVVTINSSDDDDDELSSASRHRQPQRQQSQRQQPQRRQSISEAKQKYLDEKNAEYKKAYISPEKKKNNKKNIRSKKTDSENWRDVPKFEQYKNQLFDNKKQFMEFLPYVHEIAFSGGSGRARITDLKGGRKELALQLSKEYEPQGLNFIGSHARKRTDLIILPTTVEEMSPSKTRQSGGGVPMIHINDFLKFTGRPDLMDKLQIL